MWAFFAGAMRFSSTSLIGNPNLVTKIYMPREIFPLASILSQLLDFGVAAGIVPIVFIGRRLGASWQLLWVPVLLFITIALATGWALILSAACLFFRDVKYLVEVIITFAIFITPVFYDVEMFKKWANLLMLNPLAPLIEGFNSTIVYGRPPDLPWLAYSTVFAFVSLVLGFLSLQALGTVFRGEYLVAADIVLQVSNVSKKFVRGEIHDSLRDLIPAMAARLTGRSRRLHGQEGFLGPSKCKFRAHAAAKPSASSARMAPAKAPS